MLLVIQTLMFTLKTGCTYLDFEFPPLCMGFFTCEDWFPGLIIEIGSPVSMIPDLGHQPRGDNLQTKVVLNP